MELWYTAGKTFAMLCVVLGVLLAFLYALKRLTQKGGINQCQIKLISSFSIAPRKQIMVLDVMQERLVLGVTADHISCISKYQLDDIPDEVPLLAKDLNMSSSDDETHVEHSTLKDKYSLDTYNINPNKISQVQSEK
jgi:flagellar biosynthetic protein FliO